MNLVKRISALLLSLALLASLSLGAWAAEEPYTYTVRLYAGAQGTLNGGGITVLGADGSLAQPELALSEDGTCVTISGLSYGDRISYAPSGVNLNSGSKYYIRGFRVSGEDNNTSKASYTVTGDTDYVVAYGVQGDLVAYTVNYVDADGNTLAPSETYYGNVGDRPVVAFLYIEGYQPQAYNLVGTLQSDAAQNSFTFIYRTASTTTATQPGDNTTENPTDNPDNNTTGGTDNNATGGNTTGGNTGNNAGGGTNNPGGNNDNNPGGGTNNPGGNTDNNNGGNGDDGSQEPSEIIDIEDPDVPLTNPDDGENQGPASVDSKDFVTVIGDLPLAAKVGIGAGVIAVVALAAWLLLIRKKQKRKTEK
jgi:hypothetical protein